MEIKPVEINNMEEMFDKLKEYNKGVVVEMFKVPASMLNDVIVGKRFEAGTALRVIAEKVTPCKFSIPAFKFTNENSNILFSDLSVETNMLIVECDFSPDLVVGELIQINNYFAKIIRLEK